MRARRLIYLTVLTLATSVALLPSSAASAATPSCGAQLQKAGGGYWTCKFADDFNGTALNRSNWGALTTAATGFTVAGECDVDDPAHIGVANGLLTLTATRLSRPAPCGWLTSQFQGVTLYTPFAQAYGRFEARVKFPSGSPFGSGFWMWPKNSVYGSASGEIDTAEYFGAYPQYVGAHTHIKDGAGGDRGGGAYCTVANPAGTFHKYAVQWQPTGLTFSYDGVPCWTSNSWTPPAPLKYSQPFDQPFFMLLSLGVADPGSSATYFPAKMQVDYVRAWK